MARWIGLPGFGTPLLGRESIQRALLHLFAPGGYVGIIKTFPAQKGAKLSLLFAGIGFSENAALIFRRETPTAYLLGNLGIGNNIYTP